MTLKETLEERAIMSKLKISREDRAQLRIILNDFTKRKTKRTIFYDLMFTLCAPQTTFKSNIKVIQELKRNKFYEKPIDLFIGTFQTEKNNLKEMLRPVRFYNNKSRYLIGAKLKFPKVLDLVWKEHGDYCYLNKDCGYDKREWLVKNIKGMGMKASSHFLRNLGYDALAIIDTHIIKFLSTQDVAAWQESITIQNISKRATTKKGYEELEMWFQTIAGHMNLTTAELDALVWKNYSNTSWEDFKY